MEERAGIRHMNRYFISGYNKEEQRQVYFTNLNIGIKGYEREAGVFHKVKEENGKELSIYKIQNRNLSDLMVCEFYEVSYKKQKRILITMYSNSFDSTEKVQVQYEIANNDIFFKGNEANIIKQQEKEMIWFDDESGLLEYVMGSNIGKFKRNADND